MSMITSDGVRLVGVSLLIDWLVLRILDRL
jgi:hypothetical protein